MGKTTLIQLVRIISVAAMIGGAGLLNGCVIASTGPVLSGGPPSHAPAYGRRARHRYYYYPDISVYYDINRRVYFYYSNGVWESAVMLPLVLRSRLGSPVTVYAPYGRPYAYYHEHRRRWVPRRIHRMPSRYMGPGRNWRDHDSDRTPPPPPRRTYPGGGYTPAPGRSYAPPPARPAAPPLPARAPGTVPLEARTPRPRKGIGDVLEERKPQERKRLVGPGG